MPIRVVELFLGTGEAFPRVLANRRANRIDGTVSSAFGAAAAGDGPVVLLIGDVALAHDIGGLLAGRRLALALTVVLINNDGGGIVWFLPVSTQTDVFEEHVATPHGPDFSHAAALWMPACGGSRRRRAQGCTGRISRRGRHDDHRGPHRATGQFDAAPSCRQGGAGRSQPVSAGSITPSLSSDSANSAAGSESATIPQPA